jgi:hypothetical protein
MESERCLKYGDRIILKSKSQNIALASKGIETNSATYYIRMPDEGYLENPLLYPNNLEMIFEIHPQLNYEAHTEFNDLSDGDPGKKTAEKRMQLEDNLNKTKLSENHGMLVYLDSIVQLYHVATGTYLQMNSQKIAELDMGAMGSSRITSELCQFKVSLPFGFYKKGTPMNYNSSFVLIDSTKKTLAYPLTESNWKKLQIKPFQSLKQEGFGFGWFGGSKEYVAEALPYMIENQTSFKGYLAGHINVADLTDSFGNSFEAVKCSQYFERSDSSLLWSNNITIRKLENSSGKVSALISEVNKSSQKGTPLYRYIEKADVKKLIGIESQFQIIPLKAADMGKAIGYNKTNSVFCLLKCLLSGRFLKEDPEKKELVLAQDFEKEKQQIIAQKDEIESKYKENYAKYEAGHYQPGEFNEMETELFKMKSKSYFRTNRDYFEEYLRRLTFKIVKMSSDNDACINSSNFFKIVAPSGRFLIQHDTRLKILSQEEQKETYFTDNFDVMMQKSYVEDFKLSFSEKPEGYDLFYFQEVGVSMELILTRISAILPSICRAPTVELIDTMFLLEYTDSITRLIMLFNDITGERTADRIELQALFRQTAVIDIILRFLGQIHQSSSSGSPLAANSFEACERSVVLLEMLVKNNKFNSLYVFQWKNMINSVILEGKNDVLMKTNLDTLYFSIIDNLQFNWVYTKDFIQPLCSRIRFSSFDCHKIEILIKILKSFNSNTDEKNIEIIYHSIFHHQLQEEIFKRFKLQEDGSVVIELEKNKILTIDEHLQDDEEKYRYLMLIVKLGSVLADLDLLKVSKKLSEIFPKEACMKLIECEKLPDDFRCLVLTIYSTIYILNPVYHYKMLKFSDKVIVPDEVDLSPSPMKKATNIFAESLMKPHIQKAIERVDLGELLTNVDNKNFLNKFMADNKSDDNKAILYSSLKITMQLLETNFFTKEEIIELKNKIEKILSNDRDILMSLKSGPELKFKEFLSQASLFQRGSPTVEVDDRALQPSKSIHGTNMMDNSDNSIDAKDDFKETPIGVNADHFEYIILLLNLLLKINEVIISFELRDSLVNKKGTRKKSEEDIHSKVTLTRNEKHRRSKKLRSKLAGTKIVGLGVLHLCTETHEINSERLAQIFNELKFKNNERMYKIIIGYFSIDVPKLFFKVLEFFQKICSQKYFFFKTLRNHYLIQDELEKERYSVYKKANFLILKSVRNISRNYSTESLASYHTEMSTVVELLRDKVNEAFIHTTQESRLRQLEFNMKEQFTGSQELRMKYQLSAKEEGVLCNILNFFYMRLDCLVINQNIIWKSGFLSILIDLLSFFNTRLFSKGSDLRKQKFEGGYLFDDGIFSPEDRIYSEVNFAILLLLYYSVYHNTQVAAFILNSEGDKMLNMLISYLQSTELAIKKMALMILAMVFGSSFENVYSINKRYRAFFLAIVSEFVRECKTTPLNHEILVNYLELFKCVTNFNNLIFEKNYEMVHDAVASLHYTIHKNQILMVNHLLDEEVRDCLKNYFKDRDLKRVAKKVDLKKIRVQYNKTRTTKSPENRTGNTTPAGSVRAMIFAKDAELPDDVDETDSIFTVAEIPDLVLFANQLLRYFTNIASLGSNDLRFKLRKLLSVSTILNLFCVAKEFWFFKITLLEFLTTVFINQKLDLKAKGQIFQFIREVVMQDVKDYLQGKDLAKYAAPLYAKSDFTQICALHLKKENDPSICFNFFCFDYQDSHAQYIRETVVLFLRHFSTVCHQDSNASMVDGLLALVEDVKHENPSAVLSQAVLELAGKLAIGGSQRDLFAVGADRKKISTLLQQPKESIDLKRAEFLSKLGRLFENEVQSGPTNYAQSIESEETDLFLIHQFLREDGHELDRKTIENVKEQYNMEFNDLNAILKAELEKLWKSDTNCYLKFLQQCCHMLSNARADPQVLRLLFKFLEEQLKLQPDSEKSAFIDELIKAPLIPNFFMLIYQREKDRGLVLKALNFLKELLILGGSRLQAKIYEELSKESDNKFPNILLKYWEESITNFNEIELLKYQLHNAASKVKYHREALESKLDDKCNKQIDSITSILELLRLFCEDHYLKLQNYLRIQTFENGLLKASQVNFIEKVIIFFKLYIKVAKEDNEEIGRYLLRFLIETVQGPCRENQVEAIKKKLLEPLEDLHCNLIYSTYNLRKESKIEFINLILTLKLGLIESTQDTYIIKTLTISLNLELIWLRITAIYCDLNNIKIRLSQIGEPETAGRASLENSGTFSKEMINNLLGMGEDNGESSTKTSKIDKHSNYSINMVEALNSMILISQLSNYGESISTLIENSYLKLSDHLKIVTKARRFFMDKIQSIEFIDPDQHLQTLYFYIHPKTNFLSHFSILKFEEHVDRKNWTTKVTDLMKFIPKSYLEIKHNYALYSRLGIHVSVSSFYAFKFVNFFIAIVVNIIFLSHRKFPNEVDTTEIFRPWAQADKIERTAEVLCYLLIVNYSLAFLLYLVYEFVVKLEIIFLDQNKHEVDHHVYQATEATQVNPIFYKMRRYAKIAYRIFFHTKFLQIAGLLLACVLGLTKSKLFFSFVLLDIIDISPVLLNVIRSVTINFAALSTTWVFITIVVFIYSSIAYFNRALKNNMVPHDQPELDVCSNFAMCFWNMMIFGIKSGGGIGDIMSVPDHRISEEDYAARTFFDMIFFMSIILICMNIILGIIIDSFAELRDIRNQIRRLR